MEVLKNCSNAMSLIDDFRKTYGIKEDELNIYEIKSKNGERVFTLKCGKEGNSGPFFVLDEDGEIYTMSSFSSLSFFMQKMEKLKQDNFELRLEKAIYQQIPIDFNDVWAVAVNKIQNDFAKSDYAEIDFERLIKDIKAKHPNLFVDMQSVLEKAGANERL